MTLTPGMGVVVGGDHLGPQTSQEKTVRTKTVHTSGTENRKNVDKNRKQSLKYVPIYRKI